jgi:hypothetical protein
MTDTTMTAPQVATAEEAAERQAKIDGLRALAGWLEANPEVPIPYAIDATVFTDMAEARAIRKHAHGWSKGGSGDWLTYMLSFAGDGYSGVGYHILVAKADASCRRVQKGVKHVEAVEAHDEPVYEWVCDPAAGDTEGMS